MQPLCFRLSGCHEPVAEHRDELQGAFHDETVGTQGRENVVHLRKRLYHAVASERAGHVEKHHIRFHVLGGNHPLCIVECVHRIAFDDGIGVLLNLAEMVTRESLEVGTAVDESHFVFTQTVDAVLRIVAVHDGDIVTFHVVEVTGGKCRDGGFADASFLCCECNEDFLTHCSIYFNCW